MSPLIQKYGRKQFVAIAYLFEKFFQIIEIFICPFLLETMFLQEKIAKVKFSIVQQQRKNFTVLDELISCFLFANQIFFVHNENPTCLFDISHIQYVNACTLKSDYQSTDQFDFAIRNLCYDEISSKLRNFSIWLRNMSADV